MLEAAIYYGISIEEFWRLSIADIQLTMEARQKKEEDRLKLRLESIYFQAVMAGVATSFYNPIGKGVEKIPELYECFPELFKYEPKKQDWRVAKDRLLRFADAHNKQAREKE